MRDINTQRKLLICNMLESKINLLLEREFEYIYFRVHFLAVNRERYLRTLHIPENREVITGQLIA